MNEKKPTPNDQRSVVKNPNNPEFYTDQRNQEKQTKDQDQEERKKRAGQKSEE